MPLSSLQRPRAGYEPSRRAGLWRVRGLGIEHGGIKEIPISGERMVLTDDVVRRLASAAMKIKQVFHGKDQDIEWAFMKGQIYIVQSRPYIAGG